VSGSNLEDILAIYGAYQRRGLEPSAVVLGIDPWMLNRNNGQNRWQVVADDYYQFLDVLQVKAEGTASDQNNWLDKMQQLVSYDYTKSSIRKLRTGNFGEYYPTESDVVDDFLKRKDGSILYGKELRTTPVETVNQVAKKAADTYPIYSLGDFTELDQGEQEKLEKFVSYLQERKTSITIYLPPYHPILYQTLATSSEYKKVLEAERYLRELARGHNIPVIGSYDPAACGATEQDFYDDMHPKSEFVHILFSR
jgi:hypothetical protein